METGNGHVASITNDWWTGEVLLSLTPRANADDALSAGKLSLASLADPTDPTFCSSGMGAWASWYQARLFANGNVVYVTVPVYGNANGKRTGKVVVAAIDVANPAAPSLLGKSEIKLTEHDASNGYYGYYSYGFWDGYEYYSYWGGGSSSLVGSGQGIVQLGSKLAYLEVDHEPYTVPLSNGRTRYEAKINRKLHVADFAAPAAPVVHGGIDLGESYGTAPLHLINGTVLTSRWIRSTRNPDKVRFFADRVDIGGAAPVRLPSINTPGSLLLADPVSNRFVTTDYSAERSGAADYQSCQQKFGWRGQFNYDINECLRVTRTFKLSDVSGSKVTLRQSFAPPSQNIAGVQIADDRIYITRQKRYDYSSSTSSPGGEYHEPSVIENGGLWVLGGIRSGELGIVSEMVGDAEWPLAAHGTKVALYTQGGLAIYDTQTPVPTLLNETNLRGWGYSSHVLLGENSAICSLNEWGLQTITYEDRRRIERSRRATHSGLRWIHRGPETDGMLGEGHEHDEPQRAAEHHSVRREETDLEAARRTERHAPVGAHGRDSDREEEPERRSDPSAREGAHHRRHAEQDGRDHAGEQRACAHPWFGIERVVADHPSEEGPIDRDLRVEGEERSA